RLDGVHHAAVRHLNRADWILGRVLVEELLAMRHELHAGGGRDVHARARIGRAACRTAAVAARREREAEREHGGTDEPGIRGEGGSRPAWREAAHEVSSLKNDR